MPDSQRDMLEHPIFRVAPTIASAHIRAMALPRWVEPQSGDEIAVR
jgi:hypothetical protein